MPYVELVAILAVCQFLFFGAMTGRARKKTGLLAPAIIGAPEFERMYRVQMNTLELLVAFLPALFIAGKHQDPIWMAVLGSFYIVGRFIYWQAYVKAPASRGIGFMLSLVPTLLLCVFALCGVLRAL
ncbi:MAPEG family protein [Vibrio sp. RC27]